MLGSNKVLLGTFEAEGGCDFPCTSGRERWIKGDSCVGDGIKECLAKVLLVAAAGIVDMEVASTMAGEGMALERPGISMDLD